MRMLLFLLTISILLVVPAIGQVTIQSFDEARPDTMYTPSSEGAPTLLTLRVDSSDKQQGAASMNARAVIGSFHGWGSFAQFESKWPAGTVLDFSISDSISFWVKVTTAPTIPANMVFRIHLIDQPTPGDPKEDFIYENGTILDAVSGWVNVKIPFDERVSDGSTIPNDAGFVYAPTGWGGFTYNNKKLDRDKIVGWKIAFVTSGWNPSANLPADSLEVKLDGFQRFGIRAVPAIMFNGRALNPAMSSWSWGQSSVVVQQDAGPLPKTNAILWTQGNEWGNGWTGMGYDVNPPYNLAGGWQKDSVKFTMKAEAGVGNLRIQFESGPYGNTTGARGKVFTPNADGQWHDYIIALKDLVNTEGAKLNFDSSAVTVAGMMAEGTGVAGKKVYITNWWTGNPVFDVIPPDAPTNLAGAGSGFVNLVTWSDVPNEPGVRYNVYFADHAWTDPADVTVEDLPPYDAPSAVATHPLRAPITDANVSLYYGVMAKDLAGNESPVVVMNSPVTTLAKGVPTIAKTGPASFVADGDLSEWSTITPFVLSTVSGTSHAVPNFPITDDNDLSAQAYVATDATYLYVAFDVVDDIVLAAVTGNDYEQDCADLFIGLYDWRGKRHAGYTRGATPDYHLRFSRHRIWIDNGGVRVDTISANYAWTEKVLSPGYVVEARIPWADLATKLTSGNDAVFAPVEGMRIPIDFAINDRDSDVRNGILAYSNLSNDDSYKAMFYWSYTWIGAKSTPTSVEQLSDVARSFELGQNYPNPFNPSTEIRYSIPASGPVSLRVYDMMGREVSTLVDRDQEAGSYVVKFNADRSGSTLASGVYFVRLEAGASTAIRKMLLVK